MFPKPCWILCSPRTGSSLLCEFLNNFKSFPAFDHPAIKSLPNTNLLRSDNAFNEWCRLFSKLEEFTCHPPLYSKMIFHQYIEVVGSVKKEKRYNVGWYENYHDKDFVDSTIRKYNSEWVKTIFPDIRYLKLKRNPIAHAVSLYFARHTKKYHIYDKENLTNYLNTKIDLDISKLLECHSDVMVSNSCWNPFLSEKDNVLDVNYENLISNPYEELSKIKNFLQVDCDINNAIDLTINSNKRIYKMTRPEAHEYENKLSNILKTLYD